jgi:hypothetical protein
VELAKSFGGTDGHKYVNGVLDKAAADLRPPRCRRPAAAPSPPHAADPRLSPHRAGLPHAAFPVHA